MANSVIQDSANANIGIGGSADNFYKLRITGDVYVDDSTAGNGIVLASNINNRPLISREMNQFTTGGRLHILADGDCSWNKTSCS